MATGDRYDRFTAPFGDGIFSAHGRLAQRESAAFTRQRSLVRNQHRPLRKSDVLQVKPRGGELIDAAPSTLLTTVEIPAGEPVLYCIHLRRDETRLSERVPRPRSQFAFDTKFAELLLAELRPIELLRSRRASRRVRIRLIRGTGPFAVFGKDAPIARRLAKLLKAPRKRKGGAFSPSSPRASLAIVRDNVGRLRRPLDLRILAAVALHSPNCRR